jgi:hypothetical protein
LLFNARNTGPVLVRAHDRRTYHLHRRIIERACPCTGKGRLSQISNQLL